MSEFDEYLIVDWSANSCPKRGKDSIWYCLLCRRKGLLETITLENQPPIPSTIALAAWGASCLRRD
ncbi:MAG: hypothetical protein ABSG41_27465 [Bryobacteraceae bacterium]|jgi:hypothetical protein